MLKWLVTRNSTSQSPLLTEDPLATINRSHRKNEPNYSVSRVNPIFEEESFETEMSPKELNSFDEQVQNDCSEPLPTNHSSFSSIYNSSKEADSASNIFTLQSTVSKELNDGDKIIPSIQRKPATKICSHAKSVSELRKSFETSSTNKNPNSSLNGFDILQQNLKFVKSIDIAPQNSNLKSIPENLQEFNKDGIYFQRSYWPRVSHIAETLKKQAIEIIERKEEFQHNSKEKTNKRIEKLRFNPLVSVVAKDERYVTDINLPLDKQANQNKITTDNINVSTRAKDSLESKYAEEIPHCFRGHHDSNVEFRLLSTQLDSLVNEDTIRMISDPEYDNMVLPNIHDEPFPNIINNDIPLFGKAIFAGLDSSLRGRRTQTNLKSRSHPTTAQRITCSSKYNAKRRRSFAVKNLWEKSGLKTNGRKLIVNMENKDKLSKCFKNTACIIDESDHHYETLSAASSTRSLYYYSMPHKEPNTRSQELGNLSSVDDKSVYCKTKPMLNFNLNLTDFQRRLTERLRDNQRQAPLDTRSKLKDLSIQKLKCNYPGKAVMEFGLYDKRWKDNTSKKNMDPSNSQDSDWKVNEIQKSLDLARIDVSRSQVWKILYPHPRSSSYVIPPHPNNGAPFCKPVGACQDFTIDAYNLPNLMKMTTRKKKRRICYSFFVVLMGFLSFIGVIVGISWFYTGGKRIFGPL